MNIVFAKISNERAVRFRIITKIVDNETGTRTVIKSPCDILARPHIHKLYEHFSGLRDIYRNSDLNIIPCEIDGDDALFPFVWGVSADEMLYKMLLEQNIEGFLSLFRSLIELIFDQTECVKFQICEEYSSVFGDFAVPEDSRALPFADVDMIPSNFIIDEFGKWNLIDYEWVFDFPIPVDYIIYRAIHAFEFSHDLHNYFADMELYSLLGLRPDYIDIFREMEYKFKQYVMENADSTFPYAALLKESLYLQQNNMHNLTIATQNLKIAELQDQLSKTQQLYLVKSADYDTISNAFFWKITAPMRWTSDSAKYLLRNSALSHRVWNGLKRLKNRGSNVSQEQSNAEQTETAVEPRLPTADANLVCCNMYSPPDSLYILQNDTPIDVILPVYNGYNILPPLLESISRTAMRYRLIIVDDHSSDEQILPMLHAYATARENVLLVENEANMGYTRSINKALKLCMGHVVLLNSDIRLPEYWLERLITPILTDETICSATPFTNSGTICSFPTFCQDNEIYLGLSVDEIDAVFGRLRPQYTTMPTGVGFCMALNKKALDQVGLYDEENFPRGYGEENDWCQRAEQAGFRNVMVENLFVYHQHGATFSSEEKSKLQEKNSKILLEKHPNYSKDVQEYIHADPISVYRETARFMLYAPGPAPILAFNHDWGGGATYYLNKKIEKVSADGQEVVIIRYTTDREYVISRIIKEREMSACSSSLDRLFHLLPTQIQYIWVNELVSYPELGTVMNEIIKIAQKSGAQIRFLLHDYYCICPNFNLLDKDGHYCNICDPKDCMKRCQQCTDMVSWRAVWGTFLFSCNEIIAFSQDSALILQQCYPQLKNIKVIPHEVPLLRKIKPHRRNKHLTIGVIGSINIPKGEKIIEEMATLIRAKHLPVKIIIIGQTANLTSDDDIIMITGKYKREDLPDELEQNQIDIVLIPSICPETFSYTTSEAMYMGIPVACFNIGAPAERVREYEEGIIIPEISAQSALKILYSYWQSEASE